MAVTAFTAGAGEPNLVRRHTRWKKLGRGGGHRMLCGVGLGQWGGGEEQSCPPGNIWQCLETFLVVTTGEVLILVGRGQGYHQTSHKEQDNPVSLIKQRTIWFKRSIVLRLRKSRIGGELVPLSWGTEPFLVILSSQLWL